MKLRIVSVAACAALLAAPAFAQSEEEDGELDLESVDSLFGDAVVTEPTEDRADAAEEDAPVTEDDADGPGGGNEAVVSEEPPAEPSDLDRAYTHYAQCVAEAAAELEIADFAIDDIGGEAVLRCSGARAAYVNAFYFGLVPRYPGLAEPQIRATAERLVAATDAFLATKAGEEATLARANRPVDDEAISE
ncbi:MAG: hypothetical protein ABR601_00365 [Parasphingopyxis sp.]|nr:hypothetical protein [Sphingomonadales bacterium]